jgi:hypothetical protein
MAGSDLGKQTLAREPAQEAVGVCQVAAVCALRAAAQLKQAAAPCREWEQSYAYRSRYEEVLPLRSSRRRR